MNLSEFSMNDVNMMLGVQLYCYGMFVYIVVRSILHGNKPTFVSDDKEPNHFLRLRTALLYIPFMLLSLFFHAEIFQLFIMLMIVQALSEYFMIMIPDRSGENANAEYQLQTLDRLVQGLALLPSLALFHSYLMFGCAVCVSFVVFVSFFLYEVARDGEPLNQGMVRRLAVYWFGVAWVAFPLSHAQVMVNSMVIDGVKYGPVLIVLILGTGWVGDATAYYVGKNFGRVKAMPNISPNKSVEGCLGCIGGGIAFCLIVKTVQTMYHVSWLPPMSYIDYFVTGVVVTIFGIYGDMLESFVKRMGGVKDSGTFFPGHGGILDRFDTFFFAGLPMFFYYVFAVIDSTESLWDDYHMHV